MFFPDYRNVENNRGTPMNDQQYLRNNTWSYAVVECDNFIRFIAKGRLGGLQDRLDFIKAAIMAARVRQESRLLIDEREFSPTPSENETEDKAILRWLLSSDVERLGLKVASLASAEGYEYLMSVDQMLNAIPIEFKVFLSDSEAVDWLCS